MGLGTSKTQFFLFFFIIGTWHFQALSQEENQVRIRQKIHSNWRFINADIENGQAAYLDDAGWRQLDLPHDWAIEGPFTKDVYFQGGYLPYPGVGWYRKTFTIASERKRVLLEFDGVMKDAHVWVNGSFVGKWAYGYSSFAFDITEFLKSGQENLVAVRVENVDSSSRWYPGSGIYRHVWLTITDPVHVARWGTYITTPEVRSDRALVKVETTIENNNAEPVEIQLETVLLNINDQVVAADLIERQIDAAASATLIQDVYINNPRRWDIDDPYMYTAVSRVKKNGRIVDDYKTPFGIRTFRFDPVKGFIINDRVVKIKGVNLHHDLGPLGSAVSDRALERQLEIMQSMGANAIRTAHNPPAPEQLDLCDRMGIVVMDEAFDEWRKPKWNVSKGYSVLFDQWAKKDMEALVRRDRNHPSVILWSTGNEVPELGTGKVRISGGKAGDGQEAYWDQSGEIIAITTGDEQWYVRYDGKKLSRLQEGEDRKILEKMKNIPFVSGNVLDLKGFMDDESVYHFDFWDNEDGKRSAKMLTDICHDLDPSRPVSSGIHLSIRLDQELMDQFDVAGFNYWHKQLEELHRSYPEKPILVTESAAVLSSRGAYFFPVERIYQGWQHESMQISSYDLTNTGFGTLPDVEFRLQDDFHWLAGQFVWAGFDYHGEPDPFEDSWPAHSSYFGIVDMCGFPKDRFYLYQSVWTDEPMIHLLPHWNWEGREGKITPVFCYTNCDAAELVVNGKSMGKKSKGGGEYRLRWDDVTYQPGFIKAVGYDEEGNVLCEKQIETAGKPDRIELLPDRSAIRADGEDLVFITFLIVDSEGNLCPKAGNLVNFSISGAATLAAVGNGNPISHESYQAPYRSAFNGLGLLILRATNDPGNIQVKAESAGLHPSDLALISE